MEKKELKKLFIELFISGLIPPYKPNIKIPDSLFTEFLSLIGVKTDLEQQILTNFDGISRENFEAKTIENLEIEIKRKVEVLQKKVDSFDLVKQGKLKWIHTDQISKKSHLLAAYNFFSRRTGLNNKSNFKIYDLSINKLEKLEHLMTVLGKDVLMLDCLKMISDELLFNDLYLMNEKIVVDKCADACWNLYERDPNLSEDSFLEKIQNNYFIRAYQEDDPNARKKKTKNAAKKWLLYVKQNKGIIFQ